MSGAVPITQASAGSITVHKPSDSGPSSLKRLQARSLAAQKFAAVYDNDYEVRVTIGNDVILTKMKDFHVAFNF